MKLLLALRILSFLPHFTLGKLKCDQRLLSTFQLRGLHYAARDKMRICPMVEERCCTLMDQIAILKLWKQHGQVSTRLYSDTFYASVRILVKYINFLMESLQEKDIIVHYAKHKWIPYLKNYCQYVSHPRSQSAELDRQRVDELFPGKDNMVPVDKRTIGRERIEEALLEESDRMAKELYLGMLARGAYSDLFNFYRYENLYYDESDLKSIDLKKIVYSKISLEGERNQFLKYINVITVTIFKIFNKMNAKYQKRVNSIKMNAIQNNFQLAYKNILKEIEHFMKKYNEIKLPMDRFTIIRAFGEHIKIKALQLIAYLSKLEKIFSQYAKDELNQQKLLKMKEKGLENAQKQFKAMQSLPKLGELKGIFTEGDIFQDERKMDPKNDLNKTVSREKYNQNMILDKEKKTTNNSVDMILKMGRGLQGKKEFEEV